MAELDYERIASLVQRTQSGESGAFEQLYRLTYRSLYQMACRYLRDADLAQDAVQETYMLVLKNLAALQNPKLFISWLDQILFRVCLAMQKKCRQGNEESFEDSAAELDRMSRWADSTALPENAAIRIDQKRYILEQVMQLPQPEAEAILLRYYHNLKINDVAAVLHISRATVNRRLLRGRKRLKRLLEP